MRSTVPVVGAECVVVGRAHLQTRDRDAVRSTRRAVRLNVGYGCCSVPVGVGDRREGRVDLERERGAVDWVTGRCGPGQELHLRAARNRKYWRNKTRGP